MIKLDEAVVEETSPSQDSTDRQSVTEGSPNFHNISADVERDVMEEHIGCGPSNNSTKAILNSALDFNPNGFADTGMKITIR